ncbi:hypothetical protein IQ06DRAFT_104463 [Phaeosphaeriaceae sp. SRC1lsM3a]|nr:hypothetical protein IQ06DRAFT_104463 [Stagonospora sp. SRC1lsM3a]
MAPQRTLGPVDVQEYPQTAADTIAPLPADGQSPPGPPFQMPTPWIPELEHALPSKTPYAKAYPPYNSLYNGLPTPTALGASTVPYAYTGSVIWTEVSSSSPSWTTLASTTPLSSTAAMFEDTTSCLSSTTDDLYSYRTAFPYENGPPSWKDHRGKMNNGGMYAAAAITPILVLAIIAGIAYFCMRKRKRQRAEAAAAAAQTRVEEMKMQPRSQPTTQAYMAPPMSPVPQFLSSNVHLRPPPNVARAQPIIYGPVPSGANGAYFTGIDTSDAISMNSANNVPPALPVSSTDNDSLVEPPPPPYRPRSAAPPSFTNSSRHSSIRVSMAPPLTSRTQLIERSPFDDPIDDDAISELSGPTTGRGDDAMSAVSDCSYQNEPVVNRSSL